MEKERSEPMSRRQFIQLASGIVAAYPFTTGFSSLGDDVVPSDVLFFSDWRHARGNSEAAVTDGRKWNVLSRGASETMKVVPATGLDFPSQNVFQMTAIERMQGFGIVRKTGMPIPRVGESRYYRWYFRMMQVDDVEDYQTHPIQDGNAGSIANWMFIVYNGGAKSGIPKGKGQPQFWSDAANGLNSRWYGPILNKNQTYRFELQIDRVESSRFRMHVRIYSHAGNLIADDKHFHNFDKTARLSGNSLMLFNNVNNLDGLNAGNNGIAPPAPFPFIYAYEGCFAVRSDDWCGPYTGAF
jgi:hypothetical protein